MTLEEDAGGDHPPAIQTRSRWPGLIWAVPCAALLIAIYLGVQAFADRGIDVVVTFPEAPGVKPGSTKVIYLGVEAGKVSKVELNRDGRRVDVTLNLMSRAKPAMVTGTVFFLVGAKPDLSDPASLRSAISGVSIGAYPSHAGTPTRHFDGLEKAPAVAPGTPGTPVTLLSADPVMVKPDTKVAYRGVDVGEVMDVSLAGRQSTRVDIFVRAPFNKLLGPGSRFWSVGALDVSSTRGGLSAHVDTDAALAGKIAFSTPDGSEANTPVRPGSAFPLYRDEGQAHDAITGPAVMYQAHFPSAVGSLREGSPVMLGDRAVGAVRSVTFNIDEGSGSLATGVTFALSPDALSLTSSSPTTDEAWRHRTDALVDKMLRRGWRLALRQSPPFVGAKVLELQHGQGAGRLSAASPFPEVPAAAADEDIAGKADQLLDKLNRLPIAEIGQNVDRATANLARVSGSPEIAQAVHHANAALGNADAILAEAKPRIGPMIASLQDAAQRLDQVASGSGAQGANVADAVREITDAARSLRALADYLDRHPEALLKGKGNGKR